MTSIITISYLQHITAFCILKVISCNFSTGGRNKGRYPSLMTQNTAGEKGEKGTDMIKSLCIRLCFGPWMGKRPRHDAVLTYVPMDLQQSSHVKSV